MVTHVFPLSKVQEAFQLRNRQVEHSSGASVTSGTASTPSDGTPEAIEGEETAIHVLIDCQRTDDSIIVLKH